MPPKRKTAPKTGKFGSQAKKGSDFFAPSSSRAHANEAPKQVSPPKRKEKVKAAAIHHWIQEVMDVHGTDEEESFERLRHAVEFTMANSNVEQLMIKAMEDYGEPTTNHKNVVANIRKRIWRYMNCPGLYYQSFFRAIQFKSEEAEAMVRRIFAWPRMYLALPNMQKEFANFRKKYRIPALYIPMGHMNPLHDEIQFFIHANQTKMERSKQAMELAGLIPNHMQTKFKTFREQLDKLEKENKGKLILKTQITFEIASFLTNFNETMTQTKKDLAKWNEEEYKKLLSYYLENRNFKKFQMFDGWKLVNERELEAHKFSVFFAIPGIRNKFEKDSQKAKEAFDLWKLGVFEDDQVDLAVNVSVIFDDVDMSYVNEEAVLLTLPNLRVLTNLEEVVTMAAKQLPDCDCEQLLNIIYKDMRHKEALHPQLRWKNGEPAACRWPKLTEDPPEIPNIESWVRKGNEARNSWVPLSCPQVVEPILCTQLSTDSHHLRSVGTPELLDIIVSPTLDINSQGFNSETMKDVPTSTQINEVNLDEVINVDADFEDVEMTELTSDGRKKNREEAIQSEIIDVDMIEVPQVNIKKEHNTVYSPYSDSVEFIEASERPIEINDSLAEVGMLEVFASPKASPVGIERILKTLITDQESQDTEMSQTTNPPTITKSPLRVPITRQKTPEVHKAAEPEQPETQNFSFELPKAPQPVKSPELRVAQQQSKTPEVAQLAKPTELRVVQPQPASTLQSLTPELFAQLQKTPKVPIQPSLLQSRVLLPSLKMPEVAQPTKNPQSANLGPIPQKPKTPEAPQTTSVSPQLSPKRRKTKDRLIIGSHMSQEASFDGLPKGNFHDWNSNRGMGDPEFRIEDADSFMEPSDSRINIENCDSFISPDPEPIFKSLPSLGVPAFSAPEPPCVTAETTNLESQGLFNCTGVLNACLEPPEQLLAMEPDDTVVQRVMPAEFEATPQKGLPIPSYKINEARFEENCLHFVITARDFFASIRSPDAEMLFGVDVEAIKELWKLCPGYKFDRHEPESDEATNIELILRNIFLHRRASDVSLRLLQEPQRSTVIPATVFKTNAAGMFEVTGSDIDPDVIEQMRLL